MKKLLFFYVILATCCQLSAQQDHQYTQFMYNKLLYNPAYAGSREVPTLTGIFRSQWMGFEGAPQSALVSFSSHFLSPRVGVGVVLSQQKIGLQRDFHASLAYSYELLKFDDVSVRAGIQASVRSLGIAWNEADPAQPLGDPSLPDLNQRTTDFYGNVGAGVFATVKDRFFAGLAVPRIYSNNIGELDSLALAKESPHFYGIGGVVFNLSDDIKLMPAVLFKYVNNAPFDADINVNLDIRQKVTAGISYRLGGDGLGESVDLLVLWQAAPQFAIGASYDFTLSDIKDYTAGSIELLVQADLKKPKNKNVFHPRFLN